MKFDIKIGNNKYPVSIYDIALACSFFFLIILASPYIEAQFKDLKLFGDIIWNLCLDLLIFNGALVVFFIVGSLLNTFDRWITKKKSL